MKRCSLLAIVLLLGSLSLVGTAPAETTPSFLLAWGSSGSGDGHFNGPVDVAVDGLGNVFVVDAGNHRIQVFDNNGVFLRKWGSYGTATGAFNSPQGICIDLDGNVYVADSGNNRVQKFNASGAFLFSIGVKGSGDGQFSSPRGVATDASGNLYVSDTANNRVQKFDSTGAFLLKWGATGAGNGQFSSPRGIKLDRDGYLLVADTVNNRIQKFTATGTYLLQWTSSVPNYVSVDYSNVVYVPVSASHQIQEFTTAGALIFAWGSGGSGDAEFNVPRGMEFDAAGDLFVADYNNNRIQKFGPPATAPDITLAIGGGLGLPGSITVPVLLTNPVAATALEFRVTDTPEWFHVTGIQARGRAAGMMVSFADDGGLHVLVYSPARQPLPVGSGEILEVTGEIAPEAVVGDSISLHMATLTVVGSDGLPMTAASVDGVIRIGRIPGDLTGNNVLDAGDLVRLVEIILGQGAPPTPDELAASDCNSDSQHDILDVTCLIDLILGGSGSAPGPGASPLLAGPVSLELTNLEEVRAIQLTLADDGSDPIPTADLAPFGMYLGRDGNGKKVVIAFDPAGHAWGRGSRAPLRIGALPAEVRAFGPGGRSLEVRNVDGGFRIGIGESGGFRVLQNRPNPFRSGTSIDFTLDQAGRVGLSIFNVQGRLVTAFPARPAAAGSNSWAWDGRSAEGRLLPAGMYWGVLANGGEKRSVRMLLLRP